MTENQTPPSPEKITPNPTILLVDLDETMLRRKKQSVDEIQRVVAGLNRWCKFNNVLPVVVTQKPAEFFIENSTISDAEKYRQFLGLQWTIDGEEMAMPFVVCEMGCYAMLTGESGEEQIVTNPLFDEFFKNTEGSVSPRQKLIDLIQEKYVTPGLGNFEEGRSAGVSLIVSPDGIRKYGGNLDETKKRIATEIKAEEEWKSIEPFVEIVTDGNDVDCELKLVGQQGKLVAVDLIKDILENHSQFKENDKYRKILNLIKKYGNQIFGVVDDKGYAANVAAITFKNAGGIAATQEAADEDFKATVSTAGGSVSPTPRALGAMAGLQTEFVKRHEEEIRLKAADFKRRFDKVENLEPGDALIINIGEDEVSNAIVNDSKSDSFLPADKVKTANILLNEEYLNFLLTKISLNPDVFINAIFTVNFNSSEEQQLIQTFFTRLNSIFTRKRLEARMSIVMVSPRGLNGNQNASCTIKLPDYLETNVLLNKDDPRFTHWQYDINTKNSRNETLDQAARTISAFMRPSVYNR